jgi:hypothetical protein
MSLHQSAFQYRIKRLHLSNIYQRKIVRLQKHLHLFMIIIIAGFLQTKIHYPQPECWLKTTFDDVYNALWI